MDDHVSLVDEVNKPLVIHNDQDRDNNNDHDYYNRPNTNGEAETTLTEAPSINKQHQLYH